MIYQNSQCNTHHYINLFTYHEHKFILYQISARVGHSVKLKTDKANILFPVHVNTHKKATGKISLLNAINLFIYIHISEYIVVFITYNCKT